MKQQKEKNTAFIDGQNLYLGTKEKGWAVNHLRFRRYLRDKYKVDEAYYYLGFVNEEVQDLYDNLQKAGFILVFREHSSALRGNKKGNVDCDIVFGVMKKILDNSLVGKVVLVSGDGDYKKMVDFLIKENLLKKILFPNREFASSLYKKIGGSYYAYLEDEDVKSKICLK